MKDKKVELQKIYFFLPNLFTAINMGCGFFAILSAANGLYYKACVLIGVGAIFDMFDGKVARWTGTQSAFGEQFDSLSDLLTFGLAPTLIFYYRFLHVLNRPGMILSLLFLICAALRLARFNSNINKVSSAFFQGLPTPAAALGLVSFVLFSLETDIVFVRPLFIAYTLFYSFLMISTIPFQSFKGGDFLARHRKKILLGIILALLCVLLYEEIMIFILINLYVFLSLMYFIKHRARFKLDFIDLQDEDE